MSDSHSQHDPHGTHGSHDPHDAPEAHAAPLWILFAVFAALLVLTVVTVGTAMFVDLGEFNLPLAMAIALVKGSLVAAFFMHLYWDNLFNTLSLLSALAFLSLFISFSIMDSGQTLSDVEPYSKTLSVEAVSSPGAMWELGHGAADEHEAAEGAEEGAEGATAPAADDTETAE